jgi:16S rRNA (cytosine1402-N4)-methyltransferase
LQFSHQPVLFDEVVSLLKPGVGKVIADGTLGGGGHAEGLLEAGATVIGIDRDPRAVDAAHRRLARFSERFRAVEGNFAELEDILRREQLLPVDGVLLDLGVSSAQLEDPSRGFSFQSDGPLDMRMGPAGPTAAELIASTDERSLEALIRRYGEERFAKGIARRLKRSLPRTTAAAVEEVKRAVPRGAWPKHIHVATKTFQALRLAVNREMEALGAVLDELPRLLTVGGRAAIISFHSLEDRKVKEGFRDLEGRCRCPRDLPVCVCGALGSFSVKTRKAISPGEAEVRRNPRARSARLRAVEKLR